MEILQNFGFQPTLFIAQIVNFLILAYVFKRFLYKPILKTLKERQKTIAKGLSDAEDAAREKELALSKKEEVLNEAAKEAEKIIDSTKKSAEDLKEEILSEAKKEAEKIITSAKEQADIQMESMEKRAKQASLDNSMAILEKALSSLFTKEERSKILSRSVKELKDID
ncbi:MAG: F0F1 ATP synthase subunit B [Candidatus Levyibacteriota bacterium]